MRRTFLSSAELHSCAERRLIWMGNEGEHQERTNTDRTKETQKSEESLDGNKDVKDAAKDRTDLIHSDLVEEQAKLLQQLRANSAGGNQDLRQFLGGLSKSTDYKMPDNRLVAGPTRKEIRYDSTSVNDASPLTTEKKPSATIEENARRRNEIVNNVVRATAAVEQAQRNLNESLAAQKPVLEKYNTEKQADTKKGQGEIEYLKGEVQSYEKLLQNVKTRQAAEPENGALAARITMYESKLADAKEKLAKEPQRFKAESFSRYDLEKTERELQPLTTAVETCKRALQQAEAQRDASIAEKNRVLPELRRESNTVLELAREQLESGCGKREILHALKDIHTLKAPEKNAPVAEKNAYNAQVRDILRNGVARTLRFTLEQESKENKDKKGTYKAMFNSMDADTATLLKSVASDLPELDASTRKIIDDLILQTTETNNRDSTLLSDETNIGKQLLALREPGTSVAEQLDEKTQEELIEALSVDISRALHSIKNANTVQDVRASEKVIATMEQRLTRFRELGMIPATPDAKQNQLINVAKDCRSLLQHQSAKIDAADAFCLQLWKQINSFRDGAGYNMVKSAQDSADAVGPISSATGVKGGLEAAAKVDADRYMALRKVADRSYTGTPEQRVEQAKKAYADAVKQPDFSEANRLLEKGAWNAAVTEGVMEWLSPGGKSLSNVFKGEGDFGDIAAAVAHTVIDTVPIFRAGKLVPRVAGNLATNFIEHKLVSKVQPPKE